MKAARLALPLLALPLLALSGCVAQTGVVYGTFEIPPERSGSRCENYARQTYYNVYSDRHDSGDSFGARGFARANAEAAAERAYRRCLSGRLN